MSRILQAAVLALTASGAVTLATPAGAQDVPVRKMSLAECVAAALRDNPDIKTSTDQVAVARGGRLEAGGRLGPLLRVDGSLQEWNSDYSIPFQLDPSQPPVNFPVRDQLTWNFSASAIQPITGLWSLYETYRVRDLGVDVAAIQREATLRDVGYFRTVEAYYRLLQAERLEEVASASVEQLDGQRKRANSFHDNGVVSKDDVLRAELAVANAKQRQILARAHVSLTRSRLAVQMGLSPSAAIDAVPLAGEPSVGNDVTL
ncbi:MAG TPA: TolC family protein [Polyangiaceae bacterium]|nr:TolC family protein [Polyangiaceae bacterium]